MNPYYPHSETRSTPPETYETAMMIDDGAGEVRQELLHGAMTRTTINVRGKVEKHLRRLFKAGLDQFERRHGRAHRPDTETLNAWVKDVADDFMYKTKSRRTTKRRSEFMSVRTDAAKAFDAAYKMGWGYASGSPIAQMKTEKPAKQTPTSKVPPKYYDMFMLFCKWVMAKHKENKVVVIIDTHSPHGFPSRFISYVQEIDNASSPYKPEHVFSTPISRGFMQAMLSRNLLGIAGRTSRGEDIFGVTADTISAYVENLKLDCKRSVEFILSPEGRRRAEAFGIYHETPRQRADEREQKCARDLGDVQAFIAHLRRIYESMPETQAEPLAEPERNAPGSDEPSWD